MRIFRRNILSLHIIFIKRTMRKEIILIAALSLFALTTAVAQSPSGDITARKAAVEELMERMRWADARAILGTMRGELDPVKDRFEIEWVDYHSVRCAVELGSEDAENMMIGFLDEYPASLYGNRMQFQLASYYCDEGALSVAKEEFERVKYKALDAREKERYDIRMGYIRFIEGDYSASLEHFQRISRQSDYYPHALYYISYIAYVNEEFDAATDGFKQLVDVEPYRGLAPFYLIQIEYRRGNYDYVVESGEQLVNAANGEVYDDLVRVMAEAYFAKRDYSQAIRYIKQYPNEKMGRQENYIKGYSLYRMTRYSEAVEPLKSVCGADDDLTQNASYHLGDCYLRLGEKSAAADAFAMASSSDFDKDIEEDALLNYGRLKYELGGGRFNEAVNILTEYSERYPRSKHIEEVHSLLIAAYYNSENYDAAYAAIKSLANPDNEIKAALQKVALFRAVEAVERGDLTSAEELLSEAEQIGLSPKYNALTLYWQGEVAYLRGDMQRAEERYMAYMRRAPKSEVEYAYANYGLGYARFAEGKMEAAADAFEEFVQAYSTRDGYMYDAHNRLGDARYTLREFAKARKAYNVVLSSTSSGRDYARYQLAMVDGIERKTKSKIERLKSIVEDGKGDYVDDAWYELGRTYMAEERYKEGAQVLRDFTNTDTGSPYYISALSDLGLAYYNINQRSEALKCYEEVVAYDPQSSAALEAMRGIREIYVGEGRIDDYFAYAERSGVQSDMSAAARDSLSFAAAKTLYLDGSMADAREKLKGYLKNFKSGYYRTEALFYLSDCYVQEGDNDSAISSMEELLKQGKTQYTERVLGVYAPMAFDMKLYEKSADAYRNLYDVAYNESTRRLASEGYAEATVLSKDGLLIKAMYDNLLAMPDATSWALRHAMLAKANVLREEGSDEAISLYTELSKDISTVEGAEAYYRLIEDKFNKTEYADAEQMVYNMGNSGSMYWQAKSFIILGDILVKQGNNFQARATYQSIVDGYTPADDGIVAEAKARIKNLK